jgi:hypothetical protein
MPIQDFKHSKASIDSIPRRLRRTVPDILAPENRRSGSADIAGIDSISRATCSNLGIPSAEF